MSFKKKKSTNNIPQKEKDIMIAFFVQHFREHRSIRSLSKQYAEFRGTGTLFGMYQSRFSTHLVPNIHAIDCSIKTKLEIYRKFHIKVSEEYMEEITKQANIKLDSEGIIVDFKMKDEPDDENAANGPDGYDSEDNVTTVRVTEKQKNNLWKFMMANYKKYTKWQLSIEYAAFQGGRRRNSTFDDLIAPHIHLANGSITMKLDICRKYKVRLSEESLKEFKKHAELTMEERGWIVGFKMKDQPDAEEEPNGDDAVEGQIAGPSTSRKRRRRRRKLDRKKEDGSNAVEESDVEDVVPEASSPPKRKRGRPPKASSEKKLKRRRVVGDKEEDLIVDAVKPGTGIPNPDMIIVVPKQEELDDQDQGYYHQGDNGMEQRLMTEMWSMKQGMMDEMKVQMNEMATSMNRNMQGFMRKEIDSLKKDNKTLAETVASLQKTTSDRPHESEDVETVPNKKECLLKLKDFVHSLNSPEIEGIKQRIDKIIQDLPEDNEDPMPTRKIVVALDSMLLMLDQ